MRTFGHDRADLGFDFASSDRPGLVTALLAAAGAPEQSADWWAAPVGARTAALLQLAGPAPMKPLLDCPACGERIEAELPIDSLVGLDPGVDCIDAAGVLLRRPTGADLCVLQRTGTLPARWWRVGEGIGAAIDDDAALEALSEADPLVGFQLQCRCPACGLESTSEVDLETLALRRLAAAQARLEREVHALASHYGWTEEQILAVAPARRARYLALIEGA
jgi:hypothetical protein